MTTTIRTTAGSVVLEAELNERRASQPDRPRVGRCDPVTELAPNPRRVAAGRENQKKSFLENMDSFGKEVEGTVLSIREN